MRNTVIIAKYGGADSAQNVYVRCADLKQTSIHVLASYEASFRVQMDLSTAEITVHHPDIFRTCTHKIILFRWSVANGCSAEGLAL